MIRVYMELLRAKLVKDKAPEVSIGDLVYVQHDKEIVEAKVEDIEKFLKSVPENGETIVKQYLDEVAKQQGSVK